MWSWVQVRARGPVTVARLCRDSRVPRNGPWSTRPGRWVTRWLSLVGKCEKIACWFHLACWREVPLLLFLSSGVVNATKGRGTCRENVERGREREREGRYRRVWVWVWKKVRKKREKWENNNKEIMVVVLCFAMIVAQEGREREERREEREREGSEGR